MSLPKPRAYVAPPPPNILDVRRTARVVSTDVLPTMRQLALDPEQDSTDRAKQHRESRDAGP